MNTPSHQVPAPSFPAALTVLRAAREALAGLESRLDPTLLEDWTSHIAQSQGRVVLSGMGKSGLIAQKIAATFASTGCPAFFLHPAEALHGDLGMVRAEDTLLILSNSGETEEVVRLLPSLLRLGVPIGAITSRAESRLAQAARWVFSYNLPAGEGCPLNFAPMASTTLQLAWGDLLAAHHMAATDFTLERFAQFHPAGNLGSKLLKSKDLMHSDFPVVRGNSDLVAVLQAMTRGRLGMTTVLEEGRLQGVISDGDIRRALERMPDRNPTHIRALEILSRSPVTVSPETLAVEAARTLEARKITFLLVTEDQQVRGVLHIHDLLAAKVI